MDNERVARFDEHMYEYLASLRTLFHHNFVPNHHLSLHLHLCLRLFGPVHGWWAFPFERYNGLLQRLNTNNRSSELVVVPLHPAANGALTQYPDHMPLTFIRYFYLGAHLRWLFTTIQWPDKNVYKNMVDTFVKAFSSISTGMGTGLVGDFLSDPAITKASDYDDRKEVQLPRHIYKQLIDLVDVAGDRFVSLFARGTSALPILNNAAVPVPRVKRDDVTFATKRAGARDSFVLFTRPDQPTTSPTFPHAGQICDIYLHARKEQGITVMEHFLLIKEFQPLDDAHIPLDPYRQFEDLHTRLCYSRRNVTPVLVRLEDVLVHFASLEVEIDGIEEPCLVVRSLDRVSRHSSSIVAGN